MKELLESIEKINRPIRYAYFDLGGVVFSFLIKVILVHINILNFSTQNISIIILSYFPNISPFIFKLKIAI